MDSQNNGINKDSNPEKIETYSIENLKIIYGDEITKIIKSLDELQSSSIDYFSKELNNIKNDYNVFYKEINNNININATKMIKYFKLEDNLNCEDDNEKKKMILKLNNEKIVIIKQILFTHEHILDTIKQNILCLKKFLSLCQNFDKNTVHTFYEKEFENIVRNWLILKLNYENFNITKIINESNLDQNFKDFIIKSCQCKDLTMTIQNPKLYSAEDNKKIAISPEEDKKKKDKKNEDIKNISENQNNIIKLKMKNINEADGYFIKCTSFSKLKKLLLDNVTLKNNNFLYLFPYLSKLRIKACHSLDINIFKYMSTNLRKLYLTKNGFVNYEFKKIIKEYLIPSQSIRDNLEVLSFANNNIGKIDFTEIISKNVEIFRALKEMDFRKNKLTRFEYNKANFPSLNFINLCNNYINRDDLENYNNLIVLQSGNSYLMDEKFRNDYYNNLSKIISNDNAIPISYLNISYLPAKFSENYFNELKIVPSILISLKKLCLSYNWLTCETLFNFFSKIKEPINLKVLNLSGNELDDTFFETYLEKNIYMLFPKLQHLSLSSNQIGNRKVQIKYKDDFPVKEQCFSKDIYKLRLIYKFIEINKNLTKINITKNPISDIYTVVPEDKKNADISNKYIERDKDTNNIIINGFFSFLIKIRDELIENEKEHSGRDSFNVKFDCRSNVNKYSENYPYSDIPIVFKK